MAQKIKAVVVFMASAEVEFELLEGVDVSSPEQCEAAVRASIKVFGIPECLENESLEFMFPSSVILDGSGHEFEIE